MVDRLDKLKKLVVMLFLKSVAEFDELADILDSIAPLKSDLDRYLEEVHLVHKGNPSIKFDALEW